MPHKKKNKKGNAINRMITMKKITSETLMVAKTKAQDNKNKVKKENRKILKKKRKKTTKFILQSQ